MICMSVRDKKGSEKSMEYRMANRMDDISDRLEEIRDSIDNLNDAVTGISHSL